MLVHPPRPYDHHGAAATPGGRPLIHNTTTGTATASILLVEDDPRVAEPLADALRSVGYRVALAEDGQQARTLAGQVKPDLIILDLMLPDVDGLVLCATLKQIVTAPIIICSGTPRKGDAVVGLRLGADDFLPKPFDFYELEARVDAVLRRTRRRSRARTRPRT
jgi:DNA-binding response OmpR family regulator